MCRATAIAILYILVGGVASAQAQFNSIYDASTGTLPGGSCPPWTTTDTASPENPVNSGNTLVLSTSAATENIFFRQQSPFFTIPPQLVIEFRAKFISGSTNNPARSSMSVAVTTGPSTGTLFFVGNGEIFLNSGNLIKGPTAAVPTAGSFHTYRLEISSSGSVQVYYDDTLKLTGSTYSHASDFGTAQSILFGEGSSGAFGLSEWLFFRHNGGVVGCEPSSGIAMLTVYEAPGGSLPNGSCPPWDLIDTAMPEDAVNNGGRLQIGTSDYAENISYVQPLDQLPDPFVVEVRTKFISGTTNNTARTANFVTVTTAPDEGTIFFVGPGEIFLTAAGTTVRGETAIVPTTDDFHTYRIEVTAAGIVTVFYDGAFALAGTTYANATDHGPIRRVAFGEGSLGAYGSSEWTLVRHNGVATAEDTSPPVLTVPDDISATVGPGAEACGEVQLPLQVGTAVATDDCSDPVVSVSGMLAGGAFPVGETLLIWSATDDAGNVAADTQRVAVSCPVGDVVGSATLLCNGQSSAAGDVTVRLLHEGSPFRTSVTGPAGDYRFEDVRHGTYTVAIEAPAGYATTPDTRLVSVGDGEATVVPFVFTCLLSDLTGEVLGSCNGQTTGLQGITVDVYRDDGQGMDILVATTATDGQGSYRFDDLALGECMVGIVSPLGYTAAASQEVTLPTPDGSVAVPAFTLTCQVITAQPRAMGYWKHQVNVYLTGKGQAQESLADLLHYIDELVVHFNQNLVNPVIVYVPDSANTQDKLLQLQQLLTVNKGGTTLDRAKQHLLALLLNVISGKISQTEVISDGGATVSQAITLSHDLIVDGNALNDDTAKAICELVNGGQQVPDSMLPVGTRMITYSAQVAHDGRGVAFGIERVHPNPASGEVNVSLGLLRAGTASLEVFNVAGRRVWHRILAVGNGRHSVRIPEAARFAAGVYMVVLRQASATATRRMVVIR